MDYRLSVDKSIAIKNSARPVVENFFVLYSGVHLRRIFLGLLILVRNFLTFIIVVVS